MRAKSSRQRGAELACECERAARDDCRRDELRFCLEPQEPPQDGHREGTRVDGEREQQRPDDIREYQRDEERYDAVQQDYDARLRELPQCHPGAAGDRIHGALVAADTQQPANNHRAAEQRGIGAREHHAQKRKCKQRDKRGREHRIRDGRDACALHFAETRAIDREEPDDERHRDERAGCRRDGLLCRRDILRAEHAAENVGPRSVRGAVGENQQEQVERREVRMERERRYVNRACGIRCACRGERARSLRDVGNLRSVSEQRETREYQQTDDDQARLEKVRAQNGELPARERVAREYRRRRDGRRRVAHRRESHQEFCRRDNLCRHDARPGDGNHDGCDEPWALAVKIFHQVGQCVFPVTVCPRSKRNERQEPERTREHEPARGPAEPRSGIDCTDDGRPAENRGHETPRDRLCRRTLARHEKVGNVLHAPRTAHSDQHQDNEIDNQCDIHDVPCELNPLAKIEFKHMCRFGCEVSVGFNTLLIFIQHHCHYFGDLVLYFQGFCIAEQVADVLVF